MTETTPADRWTADRTTFQRVYDVVLGTQTYLTADGVAERAACSETGAREALEQLAEMGIAERRDGRPAGYRRNDAYLTWRRVESLAREHGPTELRDRVDALIDEDDAFRERFGVPEPDAVAPGESELDDRETLQDRWEALGEWRTVRRDIRILRRAVERAETRRDGRARA